MKILRLLAAAGRKVRNGYRLITGADELEGPPRDPAEPPGSNASGNVGGFGGAIGR